MYRFACLCGAIPLIAGVSIFLLWLATGWDWLVSAGVLTICFGIALVMVGFLSLSVYTWRGPGEANASRGNFVWKTLACAILLVANFPAAAAIVVGVLTIETCYAVWIHNDTGAALVGVRLQGGGCDVTVGSIPDGEVVGKWLWFDHDGRLEMRATLRGSEVSGVLDDDVSGKIGGTRKVRVRQDGTFDLTGQTGVVLLKD